MQTGARKLAYHTTSYCRCCTENSILNYYPNAEIYELTGTYAYSNIDIYIRLDLIAIPLLLLTIEIDITQGHV